MSEREALIILGHMTLTALRRPEVLRYHDNPKALLTDEEREALEVAERAIAESAGVPVAAFTGHDASGKRST